MRTAPNSDDLRTLALAERLAAAHDALFRPDRERWERRRRKSLNDQIKRDLEYGRDR